MCFESLRHDATTRAAHGNSQPARRDINHLLANNRAWVQKKKGTDPKFFEKVGTQKLTLLSTLKREQCERARLTTTYATHAQTTQHNTHQSQPPSSNRRPTPTHSTQHSAHSNTQFHAALVH